jgi:putative copper resistance protein D
MGDDIVHAIPTVFDLLALAICLGALGCRLWVLSALSPPSASLDFDALLASLWRLLVVCLAALVVSSIGELAGRAAEMSNRPLSGILPVLPTILWRTHYGRLWLVRPLVLAALWIGWWVGKARLRSRTIPALMLGLATVVAMTRSASGHAADWGDLTLPELNDWLHLLAASLWGGGLLALSLVVLPTAIKLPELRRPLIAAIARRFSALAGVALAGVLLTGLYNAWLQVGSVRAMWETPYGRTLLAKLLLVLVLLALGASNRFISVPLLQRWAGLPVARRRLLHILLVIRYLATGWRKPQGIRLVRQFRRKVWAEAICIIGVLMCTALLLHGVPARHASHGGHMRAEAGGTPGASGEAMATRHEPTGVLPDWPLHLPQGDPASGRQVFMAMACDTCHTVRGEAFEHRPTKPGPDLTGIGTRHSAADLLESLLNPDVLVQGPGSAHSAERSLMPDYRDRLTVKQLIDLVAYLQSLHGD